MSEENEDYPKEFELTVGDSTIHVEAENEKQEEKLNDFKGTLKEITEDETEEVEEEAEIEDDEPDEDKVQQGMTKDEFEELMEDREKQLSEKLNKKFDMIERIRQSIPDYRPDFKKDKTELMKGFLLKLDKFEEEDLENRSDAYIEARFDVEIENFEEQKNKPVGDNLLKTDQNSGDEESDRIKELKDNRKNLYNSGGDE